MFLILLKVLILCLIKINWGNSIKCTFLESLETNLNDSKQNGAEEETNSGYELRRQDYTKHCLWCKGEFLIKCIDYKLYTFKTLCEQFLSCFVTVDLLVSLEVMNGFLDSLILNSNSSMLVLGHDNILISDHTVKEVLDLQELVDLVTGLIIDIRVRNQDVSNQVHHKQLCHDNRNPEVGFKV